MNRIKRGIIILEGIVLVLVCCACGNMKGTTEAAEEKRGAGGLDLSYESETDCQTGIGQMPGRAYTEDGVYFIDDSENYDAGYLRFYDSATEQIVYVCPKSNCSHNGEGCMAYLGSQEYPLAYIWYYDGGLYVPKMDGDYIGIERIALDGSTREDSCTLMRINKETTGDDVENTYYPEMTIHRGYVYYTTYYPGNESADVCRVKLDSGEEPETLYSLEGTAAMIMRLKPYGANVFFQAGIYGDEQNTGINIYRYDTASGETEEYYPGVTRDFVPAGDGLYYLDLSNSIYKADPVTKKDTVFYEYGDSEWAVVSLFIKDDRLVWQKRDTDVADGRSIYVYEQTILDMDGNVVQELRGTQDDWYNSSGSLLSPY